MDLWTKGAVVVLVAYVVIVAVGLLLGRRPTAPEAMSSLIIISETDASAVELGWLAGRVNELHGQVYVLDAGNPVAAKVVERRLDRGRRLVSVVKAGPDDVPGLRLICSLTGRRSVTALFFRES